MRSPYMLDFPIDEYVSRKSNLVAALDSHGLDGIILTTEENTRYFTGFQSIVWDSKVSTPAFLVVNRNGDWLMVGSHSSIGTMSITSCMDGGDLFYYDRAALDPSVPKTYFEAITAAVGKLIPTGGRVGMETGLGFRVHMNYPNLRDLLGYLEGKSMEHVDAADLLWGIRSIKSPRELEVMRKVCAINCALYKAAYDSVRAGVTTERDVFHVMGIEAFRLGCEKILNMGIRAGLDRDPHTNCPSSSRVIGSGHEGEVLMIDGGPIYKGYYSDIIRTGVVGKPTQRQLDLHDIAVEACYVGLGHIRPGASISEATRAVDEYIDKKGMREYNITYSWIGHGIGMDVHEFPGIEISSKDVFKPGMCFAVEPCIRTPDGMFGIEQNIAVNESGYELLTPFRHDLFSIG